MNAKNLLICALLTLSSSIYAAEATQTSGTDTTTSTQNTDTSTQTSEETTVNQDIASSTSIDELIAKMNKAQNQYRYKYMNAIKAKISSSKKAERAEKIKSVLDKIHQQKTETQSMMEKAQNSKNSEKNSFGSKAEESMGNMGIGIGGASEGGMGGSGGGMGGSGGGMGGGVF
ncbi:MAG: hypothetical protein QM482_01810 [Sulfurospirillum sp.]